VPVATARQRRASIANEVGSIRFLQHEHKRVAALTVR